MQIRWSSVVIVLAVTLGLLLSACAPAQTPVTVAPAAPTAASAANGMKLTVFAASSLTDAFNEIGQAFGAEHSGVTVEFNFAGSQQLRTQLEQGATADVFASANAAEINNAIKSGLIVSGTQQTFVRNRLAVIVPKDNPGSIKELKDLAKPGLKIVLAAASVPVGGYALTVLNKMNVDFGATFSQTVIANVVSYEDNVKQVVAKVQLGEADAGIVYTSDVTPAVADKLIQIDVPDKYNVLATYPIAVLKSAPQADLAKTFADYVLSDKGQAVLQKWGFIPVKQSTSSTPAQPAMSGSAIQVTDALGRQVTFQQPPAHIVIVGKAFFMVVDAVYLFPEASQRIAAIGSSNQSSKNFLPVIDADYAKKATLDSNIGAEQIAPLHPDLVILKSSNADKLGKPLEQLNIPVLYVDLETPEQYTRDITVLGQIFGDPDRAKQILAYYQGAIDQVRQEFFQG